MRKLFKQLSTRVLIWSRGEDGLQQAIINNEVDTAIQLIQGGAPLNKADIFGSTPLHCSVSTSQNNLTILLLESKADPNLICREKYWGGKPIQPLLKPFFPLENLSSKKIKEIENTRMALVRLLVLYGTTRDGVVFYAESPEVTRVFSETEDFYRQRIYFEKRQDYRNLIALWHLLYAIECVEPFKQPEFGVLC